MRTWVLGIGCSLVLACSGSKNDDLAPATDDVGALDDTAVDVADDIADTAETAAACGTNVGDTLCDLQLQGYERDAVDGLASSAMSSTFKTSEALAVGTQHYAFIFNAAYW